MANGKDPSCVLCKHFKRVVTDKSDTLNVRSPSSDCRCLMHRVHLPYSRTSKLLICVDWEDVRGIESPVRDWDQKSLSQFRPNVLYGYSNVYAFDIESFAGISELPAF